MVLEMNYGGITVISWVYSAFLHSSFFSIIVFVVIVGIGNLPPYPKIVFEDFPPEGTLVNW